ncbi:manganese ABC transporter substrate-binding protein [Clostridium polyendosporum]|uniref:Manganese ABC transporter substrate-binding protein n=1 Tax=Clostridium polyendosporum TaxID=69208 RepID=A0A919RZ73_9CLOT|nr:zinc ABC transporter substrate-binding protein [Clostridium polyendosporum]GIM29172.1 manganese ABC transporter substrate-binding protein [Clostridium polyendosporum]
MKKFNMKKFTFLLIMVNVFFFIALSVYSTPKAANSDNNKIEERDTYLNIIVTNKLIFSMTKEIVKNKHNIEYMFKNEDEAQKFTFSQDSLDNISSMDFFLYMGSGAEPWINDFINGLKKGKVGVINLSRGTRTLNYSKPKVINNNEVKVNPYYWLSPDDYKISLYNIKSAIQDRDPKNREYYEDNYEVLIQKIDKEVEGLKQEQKILNEYNIYLLGDNLEYLMKSLGIEYSKIPLGEEPQEYIKTFGELKGSKKLIIYDDIKAMEDIKKYVVGLNVKELNIKIPNYSDDYLSYINNIKEQLKALDSSK